MIMQCWGSIMSSVKKIPVFKSIFILFLSSIFMPTSGFSEDTKVIRFGVLSIAQPSRIYEKWQPFADYMSRQLGQSVEIVIPRGFKKMKTTIAEGGVDFFYINSHVFYLLKQEGKVTAVAQMKNISDKVTSVSEIFVKKDSGIKSTLDLKGKKIAFVSPMGAGGYLAPRAYLYKTGLKSGIDSEEVFTKNLSNSIHGVLLGDYDAASMCGVNYKLMSKKIETGELDVIAISDEYPENVIGVRSNLSTDMIRQIRNELLAMKEYEEGKVILENMRSIKIREFVKYDASIEKITERMLSSGQFNP